MKAVSYFGNEKGGTEYRDSRDIAGTIPEMFAGAMSFLTSNLRHVQAGQSFNSVGVLEISRIALEELVQNALCHREYLRQAAIRILIFDNRVEIVSPGALPEGLTIEEIKLGTTAQRNPLLCTLCARTMQYRGLGSGILRAMHEVHDIEFVNEGNQFAAIIKRQGVNDKKSRSRTRQEELVAFCREPRSLQEIAERFGVSDKYRFKKKYMNELLGTVLYPTEPQSPNSPTQKYYSK